MAKNYIPFDSITDNTTFICVGWSGQPEHWNSFGVDTPIIVIKRSEPKSKIWFMTHKIYKENVLVLDKSPAIEISAIAYVWRIEKMFDTAADLLTEYPMLIGC